MIGAARGDAVRLARKRIDDLTLELAKRAGVDSTARRMIQVLACVEPLVVAVEHLTSEATPKPH